MERLLFSLVLISSGLALGYFFQILDRNGIYSPPIALPVLRKLLQKVVLLFVMPVAFCSAVWIVPFGDLRIALLPVIGAFALAVGGVAALVLAKLTRQPPMQTGVLFCCGSFTNIGAIGGLVCFMFLGEEGFALISLYKLLEEMFYYAIGFPIVRYYSGFARSEQSMVRRIFDVFKDPFVCTAMVAFGGGLLLNLFNVPRPDFLGNVSAIFVPTGVFLIIVSVGLSMHFSKVGEYLQVSLGVCVIKFILVPFLTCGFAYLAGLHQIAGGLPFQVVLVLSSMPVAFNAIVAASIFDLDIDMANSTWLVSTAALVVVMPLLYFLLHLMG